MIPLKETLEKLELSYIGLEDDYKEIFLDVACILKGWDKEVAIRVLESRGFHAKIGLRVLDQKSLITYDNGFLGMHDHLEEMGRNIVRRSHPDELQRHSRLWVNEEIEYILTNHLGTQATKCLYLDSSDLSAEIAIKGLAKMRDLRFIHIDLLKGFLNVQLWEFDKVNEYLPSSLRFMRWYGFPFLSLPNTFQGKYLVELELYHSNIVQLWEDGEEKVLNNLRFLTIGFSKLRTFDLKLAPNLEQLTIYDCYDLLEFQMPAESLKLEHLGLTDFKLTNLHLGNTPNLKKLVLRGCYNLVEFQMTAKSLKLEHLDLSHSKLKTLHLGSTPNLETLILEGCNDLVELQMPAESLKLEVLNLGHSKLRTLDLGLTPNLKRLNLENYYDLVEINALVGYQKKLAFLDLSGCGSFKYFLFNKQLDSHEVGSLCELHLIAEPTDVCLLHPDNNFLKFRFECYYQEDPASSFGNLEMLISMGLCACTNLENFSRSICSLRGLRKLTLEGSILEVPRNLDQLECLEELVFSSTYIINLPDSICKLKHLKSLELESCLLLKKLPDDLGQIESLETLIITNCNCLRDIPNNIGKINCVISPKVYKRYTHGKYKQRPINDSVDRPTRANT